MFLNTWFVYVMASHRSLARDAHLQWHISYSFIDGNIISRRCAIYILVHISIYIWHIILVRAFNAYDRLDMDKKMKNNCHSFANQLSLLYFSLIRTYLQNGHQFICVILEKKNSNQIRYAKKYDSDASVVTLPIDSFLRVEMSWIFCSVRMSFPFRK